VRVNDVASSMRRALGHGRPEGPFSLGGGHGRSDGRVRGIVFARAWSPDGAAWWMLLATSSKSLKTYISTHTLNPRLLSSMAPYDESSITSRPATSSKAH